MNILLMHIVEKPDQLGGVERVLTMMAGELSRDPNIETRVAINIGAVHKYLSDNGIQTITLPNKGIIGIPRFQNGLCKIVRQFKPDIVHSHHRYTTVLCDILPFRKYKLIHTFHGVQFNRKWNRFYGDHATAISQEVKSHFVKHFKIHEDFITVIQNGLDQRHWNETITPGETSEGKKSRAVAAVVVGRLVEQKGHKIFIRAVSLLPEAIKKDFRVSIVGDGDMRAELKGLVKRLHLEKQISFVGHQDDVRHFFDSAKFSLYPSLSGGLSLTIMESYFRGKPVIASRVGGIEEVIKDRETGLLVPPGNPVALSKAIVQFVTNHGLAKRCGEEGRNFVVNKFRLDKMVDRYKNLYRFMLEDRERNGDVANKKVS